LCSNIPKFHSKFSKQLIGNILCYGISDAGKKKVAIIALAIDDESLMNECVLSFDMQRC